MRSQAAREEQALALGGLVLVPALLFGPVAFVVWLTSSALGHAFGVDAILTVAAVLTVILSALLLGRPVSTRPTTPRA